MPISAERRAEIEQVAQQYRSGKIPKVQKPEEPSLLQNIAQGIAKPFGKFGASIVGIGGAVANLAQGDVAGAKESLTKERDLGYFGKVRPIGINEQGQQMSAGAGIKDILGTGAEIGSYLVPGTGALKGIKSVAQGGIRALPRVAADQAILGATSGVLGGAGSEAQKEGSTAESILGAGLKGGATGAAVGSALPIAGAASGAVSRFFGRTGSEVLGRTTGAGEFAIREAFNNPNVSKFAKRAGKEGSEGLMTEALDEAQKGLSKLAEERSSGYLGQLEKIKLDKRSLDSITQAVRGRARELLGEHDISLVEGKLLNNLDFADSAIEGGQNSVQKAFNSVMSWTDNTPAGLDRLKKKLGKFYNAIPREGAGDARSIVLDLRNSVDSALKSNVNGYEEMTRGWREATDLIDEIQGTLSLKDTASRDTAIRKLMSTMRQNNELRLELLRTLSGASGKDIVGKIAGATLASRTPRGLAGTLTPTAAGLTAISIAPAAIPGLILYLAATSPRLMSEFVSVLGKFKGKLIPPAIQTQLRNIIIRSIDEADDSSTPQSSVPR